MLGYGGEEARNAAAMRDGYYHTGDVASRDEDGYITYIGRADDVFKASDYRISPFELESVLIQHPAVAEAAVVPSPDPCASPCRKLSSSWPPATAPCADVARDIFVFVRQNLAPYKRIRRLEFCDLPKTISGKIRRAQLRTKSRRRPAGQRAHAAGILRRMTISVVSPARSPGQLRWLPSPSRRS